MRRQLRQQLYAAKGGVYSIKSFCFYGIIVLRCYDNYITETAAVQERLFLLAIVRAK
jgi:hypothetical protein